jgi:hypothetical protein
MRDSVMIRLEGCGNHAIGEERSFARDHSFALVVGENGTRNVEPVSYDTLAFANGCTEAVHSTIPDEFATTLLTANKIGGRVGSTTFFLNPDQLIALRAFLRRSLIGPFAP